MGLSGLSQMYVDTQAETLAQSGLHGNFTVSFTEASI